MKPEAGSGALHIVGTPIGNLDDLSIRALEALRRSDLIACEDTRRTRVILDRHGMKARLVSYHKFNEAARCETILAALREGKSVALVSDGGTPGISDPGALLVRRAREEGFRVVPVPGPSALTALLSASGLPPGPFTFIGFLPHRQGERRRMLSTLRPEARPLVFFESPHRILATLQDALEVLGDRQAVLGREMTKVHEEFLAGTLGAVRESLGRRSVKGEIAFLVAGADEAGARRTTGDAQPADESPARAVRRLVAAGCDRKEALRRVARERGLSRREVYRLVLRAAQDGEEE